jgi:uncharacterized membrane protein
MSILATLATLKRPNFDLALVAAVTLVTMLLALTPINLGFVQVLCAVLLVCVLPGYAIMAAAFPNRPFTVETLVFTLGISLSITVLGGLLLNYTVPGLTTVTWGVLLGSIILAACLVALVKRRQSEAPAPIPDAPQFTRRSLIIFGASLLVGVVALRFASAGAEAHNMAQFTQLWMTPTQQQEANLGIRNHESTPVTYKLRVVVDNKVVQEWSSITLDPGGEWKTRLTMADLGVSNRSPKVEALLYRLDAPEVVYRHVSLSR